MPLPLFLQRFRQRSQAPAPQAQPVSSADIERARVRARRRMVGMAMLVGVGVIGFPWLFETEPRPLSPDVAVVSAASVPGRLPRTAGALSGRIVDAAPAESARTTDLDEPTTPIKTVRDSAETPSPRPAARPTQKPAPIPSTKPVAKAVVKPEAKPDASARYIVQIGAFADGPTAHLARMKVERLGIKTYTQAVNTPAGKRIRVRVGPYEDKAQADKAAAAIRKAGLVNASLLTL